VKKSRIVRGDGGPKASAEESEQLHERASATPVFETKSMPSRGSGPVGAPVIGPLDSLEKWFAAVVTHPVSVADGLAAAPLAASSLEQLIKPTDRMSALDRLEVYHHGYHARLVDCLVDDYPVVQHAMGEKAFAALARKYIAAHPSTVPNLNGFGRRFAAFVGDGFIADLARLEWAMVEVIHGRRSPPLSAASLGLIPPESWPELRLMPNGTLRFLELDYPANAYFQAVRDGKKPRKPKAQRSATAVYRLEARVWRMDFTPSMAAVLRALLAGAKLGEALEASDPGEADVRMWFQEWVAGDFFREPS